MSDPQDKDRLLGHAEDNDGIEEYDNALPDWWLGLLFLTIIWAAVYSVDYHWVSRRSQESGYQNEVAAAAVRWPAPTAAKVDLGPETIAKGQQIFAQNCVGCHGTELQGGIGPKLTDPQWIHGGSLKEISATITNGVTAKGMLAWGPILGPEKVAQVAAFVYSKGPQAGLEPSATAAPAPQ